MFQFSTRQSFARSTAPMATAHTVWDASLSTTCPNLNRPKLLQFRHNQYIPSWLQLTRPQRPLRRRLHQVASAISKPQQPLLPLRLSTETFSRTVWMWVFKNIRKRWRCSKKRSLRSLIEMLFNHQRSTTWTYIPRTWSVSAALRVLPLKLRRSTTRMRHTWREATSMEMQLPTSSSWIECSSNSPAAISHRAVALSCNQIMSTWVAIKPPLTWTAQLLCQV